MDYGGVILPIFAGKFPSSDYRRRYDMGEEIYSEFEIKRSGVQIHLLAPIKVAKRDTATLLWKGVQPF